MTGEKTMPFGENNRHVPVRLIDFEDLFRVKGFFWELSK